MKIAKATIRLKEIIIRSSEDLFYEIRSRTRNEGLVIEKKRTGVEYLIFFARKKLRI